jgi:hypothetical protein
MSTIYYYAACFKNNIFIVDIMIGCCSGLINIYEGPGGGIW